MNQAVLILLKNLMWIKLSDMDTMAELSLNVELPEDDERGE